jgi:hypothetical protein
MEINLSIDSPLVRKKLTDFIRTEIARAGFSHAVVNLSGGIDWQCDCPIRPLLPIRLNMPNC